MQVSDYYEMQFTVNRELFEPPTEGISFAIQDSIHQPFPTVDFRFLDTTGLFQEYLMTVEGVKANIQYGTVNNTFRASYIISGDSLNNTLTEGVLNGKVKVSLIHEYAYQQELTRAAYNNRISAIVRQLAGGYNFRSVDVNDTGNGRIWYQPLMGDMRFIREVMMPFASSSNASGSPYFCFVDSNNVFHFRHYNSFFEKKPETELTLRPAGPAAAEDQSLVYTIRRARPGRNATWPLRRRLVTQYSQDDGSLVESEDSILDYPSNTQTLPLIENDQLTTGHLDLDEEESEPAKQENNAGLRAHTMREGLHLDRFVTTIPLYPTLRSGKVIRLSIRSRESDSGDQESLLFRGSFLIEQATHIWDGERKNGRTVLIVSRKSFTLPSTYTLHNQLMR